MSQWTHVAATIRFDAFRMMGIPSQRPDLGKTCSFGDDDEDWDLCDVPRGSEGSLQHTLWENPELNELAAYVAMIWGDLRDYSDVEEVMAYLRRITSGKMVRQGVVVIDVEGRPAVLAHVVGHEGEWVQIPAVEAA